MGLQLVTPPSSLIEPVSLDEAKNHLRIPLSDTSQDEVLQGYITGARQMMETSRFPGLDICFMTQTWNLILDTFPPDGLTFIEIPKRPVQSVSSITYTDINGNVITWPSAQYVSDLYPQLGPASGPGARILPIQSGSAVGSWPNVNPGTSLQPINAVTIQFVAGFGTDPALVSQPLKIMMLMLTGSLFEFREASGDVGDVGATPKAPIEVPFGYSMLSRMYRGDGVA